jgi:hypothetical protein
MKHLILFEGFETDEYYQFLGDSSSREIIRSKFIYFDISTIREISRLLTNYSYKYERAVNLGGPKLEFICKSNTMGPYIIDIRQLEDEWFIVHLFYIFQLVAMDNNIYKTTTTKIYKCDQISGIEKLLTDKHII